MLTAAILVTFPFAMAYAAASDLVSMTIANRVPLLLAASFLLLAPAAGLSPAAIGLHLGVGGLALAVTFGCFAAGWMGGGDAKLIAATALWLGPSDALIQYLLLASVLGGVVTLGLLSARIYFLPMTGIDFVDRLLGRQTGIPYGIALGLAGLAVYPQSFWMAAALRGVL